MSALPSKIEQKLLRELEIEASRTRLEEKNKQAAREHLLQIQLLLARRPLKDSNQ